MTEPEHYTSEQLETALLGDAPQLTSEDVAAAAGVPLDDDQARTSLQQPVQETGERRTLGVALDERIGVVLLPGGGPRFGGRAS